MGAYLYWKTKAGQAKTLWFDVVTDEQHHLKASSTDHPVEEGVDITDHIRPEVARVSLSTFVSNSPLVNKVEVAAFTGKSGKLIGAQGGNVNGKELDVPTYDPPLAPTPGSVLNALTSAIANLLNGKKEYKAQVLTFDKEFDNVQDVYDALEECRKTSQLVDVVSSTRTYKNMHIEDLNMTRGPDQGTGATFTLELKEIRVVSTLKVTAPKPAETAGFPRKDNGNKGPNPADDPTKRASYLVKGGAAIGVFTGGNTGIPGP